MVLLIDRQTIRHWVDRVDFATRKLNINRGPTFLTDYTDFTDFWKKSFDTEIIQPTLMPQLFCENINSKIPWLTLTTIVSQYLCCLSSGSSENTCSNNIAFVSVYHTPVHCSGLGASLLQQFLSRHNFHWLTIITSSSSKQENSLFSFNINQTAMQYLLWYVQLMTL